MRYFFVRTLLLSFLFFICFLFVNFFSQTKKIPLKGKLDDLLPSKLGKWEVVDREEMTPKVAKVLGVDDYVWRRYKSPDGMVVDLYISYFSYVDRIKTYHSPLNCMPGSGWNIYKLNPMTLTVKDNKKVEVNFLTLKNGNNTMVAVYWYQCRGRIINSEYKERLYRIVDSIFKRRTDGAFVRIIDMSKSPDIEELKRFSSMIINILMDVLPT